MLLTDMKNFSKTYVTTKIKYYIIKSSTLRLQKPIINNAKNKIGNYISIWVYFTFIVSYMSFIIFYQLWWNK